MNYRLLLEKMFCKTIHKKQTKCLRCNAICSTYKLEIYAEMQSRKIVCRAILFLTQCGEEFGYGWIYVPAIPVLLKYEVRIHYSLFRHMKIRFKFITVHRKERMSHFCAPCKMITKMIQKLISARRFQASMIPKEV